MEKHGTTWAAVKAVDSIPARPSTDPEKNTGPVAKQLLAVFASVFQVFDIILLPLLFISILFFFGDVGGEALNVR